MATKKNKNLNPDKDMKPRIIPDVDREKIKIIATKAKKLRESNGYSYESFALHAGINRNTYFRFEKAATTGENITLALIITIIRGLNMTISEFFSDIK
jgi:transcriptional regulator with XRE-family HTH domain